MSTNETKSHVISIRVSDSEKRRLDILAWKRKRRPSSVAKSFILEWVEKSETSSDERLAAFQRFQKNLEKKEVIQRDSQEIIDDIRKFRGDAE